MKHLRKYNEAYELPSGLPKSTVDAFNSLINYKSDLIDWIEFGAFNDDGVLFKVRENEDKCGENIYPIGSGEPKYNSLFMMRSRGMDILRVYYPRESTFLCDVRLNNLLDVTKKIEERIKNRLIHKKRLSIVSDMFERLDKEAINNYFSNIIDMSHDYKIEQVGDFEKIYWSLEFDINGIEQDILNQLVLNDTLTELVKNLLHINEVLKEENVAMTYRIELPKVAKGTRVDPYPVRVSVFALDETGKPIGTGQLRSS